MITKYMLFDTIVKSLEILTDSFVDNHFYRYKMLLKQVFHDKKFITEINET